MSIAVYVEAISRLLPIHPVTRIHPVKPQKRDTKRQAEENFSFFSIYTAASKLKDSDDPGTFHADA